MKWLNNGSHERQLPKLGLALSGGASRGVAHIGVLKALAEAQIRPDMLSGTSIGALVAAFHAFDIDISKMYHIAEEMSWSSISTLKITRAGLLSNRVIGDIVEEHIGDVNIEDAAVPLAILATDIRNGNKIVLRKGNLAKAVMASTCLPGIYSPVTIDDRPLVDGFLVENLPISPLREMHANVIVGVSLSTLQEYREPSGMINILMNAFEIAVDENVRHTIRDADLLITPELSAIAYEDDDRPQALYQEGYIAARKQIANLRSILRKEEKRLNSSVWSRIGNWLKGHEYEA